MKIYIPFSLDYYNANPKCKIVTKGENYPVRILSTDLKNERPIVAAITIGEDETIGCYWADGHTLDDPEMTLEFELNANEYWVNVYQEGVSNHIEEFSSWQEAIENIRPNYVASYDCLIYQYTAKMIRYE